VAESGKFTQSFDRDSGTRRFIFERERKLGKRPELAAVAPYAQCVARRGGPAINGAA
jgi:hypothetical protein